ncbi:histidine kinase [Arachidicoccus ginsenosidimutans]|uniref:CBS domain-containing protein n=1 Tax=Arachidicoccus sp. BS20 TaxID=1850526 RepID=UPI0007F180E5|nr:CBS domain-containing protein [Arachidicoccus sp. BS20]ANI87969.1 histidine kinase [Arachidicoccus sp. BS20]
MKTVHSILAQKPKVIFSVSKETSVYDALQLMMEKNISALLITNDSELLGIFTERDYARKIVLQGRTSRETAIGDVMTKNPVTIAPSESVDKCMKLMTENHFRHLPVRENGMTIGMVSIGDILKLIIEDQKETIDHLQSYIQS